MTQAYCEALLQSSTEQCGMQLDLPSAAVYCCCVTAHMYEEQISSGVIAVTQACCEALLQSSTEQWGMQLALPSAAVYCCCVNAHL